jgi:DUF2971 family protein
MDDYVVFKFCSIDKNLLKSLVHSEIYFALPSFLNDPFDCRVDVLRALENAITKCPPESRGALEKLRKMQGFLKEVQADLQDFGVCAFSLELNNPLMWSHYAEGHRGISLTYCFPKAYFHANADRIIGIDRMEYGTSPLTEWFIQRSPNLGSFQDFGTALVRKILTVKAKPWEYEQEVRILRRTPGVESIDRKYLRQVCFGLETGEADIALVQEIMEQGHYDVTMCRMVRSEDTDFGLMVEEI